MDVRITRDLEQLRRRNLREMIARGLDSLRRGEGVDGHEFFAQLEREEAELDKLPVEEQ